MNASRSTRSASTGAWRSRPAVGAGPRSARPPAPVGAGPGRRAAVARPPVDADVGREPRRDREAPVGGVRVRPPDDPDDGRDPALDEGRARRSRPRAGRRRPPRCVPTRSRPATGRRACGRSSTRPVIVTAAIRAPRRARRGGRAAAGAGPLPEAVERVGPQARRAVGDADPALGADPGPDRRRGRAGRQQELDRARRVLDDDPPAGRVEQRRRRGHDGVDRDVAVGDPEGRAIDTVGTTAARRARLGDPVAPATTPGGGGDQRRGRRRRGPRSGSRRARRSGSPAGRRTRRPGRSRRP